MSELRNIPKYYTLLVGAAYLLLVGVTLGLDLYRNGVHLETFHKLGHIGFGIWAAWIFLKAKDGQYIAFCLANGALWGVFAVVGWLVPDFLMLDAFNRADTVLHTIVSSTGLIATVVGLKAR